MIVLIWCGISVNAKADVLNGNFQGHESDWKQDGLLRQIVEWEGSGSNPAGWIRRNPSSIVSVELLETHLGLSAGAFAASGSTTAPSQGAAIRQAIEAKAGDSINFDFKFWSGEPSDRGATYHDFAFATLSSLSHGQLVKTLVDSTSPLLVSKTVSAFGENYYGRTPWLHTTMVVPETGTWTVGFGVIEGGDLANASSVFIDNVSLVAAPVPEPSAALMLLCGGALIGGFAAKRKEQG
ncbi:PEP-CTERM sorting domain-containing protein [Niveibacterium umoris]|uniref:Ice-binding protein C-terminal domain-containing protein n=1 Tax=Niveibacterium umoris TaxID=1193620 RepID=A0A840BS59_9RHOO|nr:PEP-CTERM sorting domain-containing protein [Niveibacterium umoris]MBB4013666.1 hypothetical protein [Niveibacterium umoris]